MKCETWFLIVEKMFLPETPVRSVEPVWGPPEKIREKGTKRQFEDRLDDKVNKSTSMDGKELTNGGFRRSKKNLSVVRIRTWRGLRQVLFGSVVLHSIPREIRMSDEEKDTSWMYYRTNRVSLYGLEIHPTIHPVIGEPEEPKGKGHTLETRHFFEYLKE